MPYAIQVASSGSCFSVNSCSHAIARPLESSPAFMRATDACR
jgi:hypothetical protein